VLLCAKPVLHDVRDEVKMKVGAVGSDTKETGDENAQKDDADDPQGEVIHDRIDQWKDLEERVIDSINKGGVQVDEGDRRILDSYFKGLDEGIDKDTRGFHALLIDLRLSHQTLIASQSSQTVCAAEEDIRG